MMIPIIAVLAVFVAMPFFRRIDASSGGFLYTNSRMGTCVAKRWPAGQALLEILAKHGVWPP